jgi:hypothetical protein
MGDVVAYRAGDKARHAPAPDTQQPATVHILPVIRIERNASAWDDLPSDSAPTYEAPDTDPA